MGFYVDCRSFSLHVFRADSPRQPHTPWHRFDWTDEFGGFGRTGPFETAFTNKARKARAMQDEGEDYEVDEGVTIEVGRLAFVWNRGALLV